METVGEGIVHAFTLHGYSIGGGGTMMGVGEGHHDGVVGVRTMNNGGEQISVPESCSVGITGAIALSGVIVRERDLVLRSLSCIIERRCPSGMDDSDSKSKRDGLAVEPRDEELCSAGLGGSGLGSRAKVSDDIAGDKRMVVESSYAEVREGVGIDIELDRLVVRSRNLSMRTLRSSFLAVVALTPVEFTIAAELCETP